MSNKFFESNDADVWLDEFIKVIDKKGIQFFNTKEALKSWFEQGVEEFYYKGLSDSWLDGFEKGIDIGTDMGYKRGYADAMKLRHKRLNNNQKK